MYSPVFTTLSVASLMALAQAASAEFGIVLGATGTQYQGATIGIAYSKLRVDSESQFTVEDDGSLKSQDGLYVSVGGDGVLAAGTSPLGGWAIKGGYLVYGTDGFYVAEGFLTTTAPSSTERLVGLLPYDSTGKVVPDFTPGGSASSAVSSAAPSAAPSAVSSAHYANTTVTSTAVKSEGHTTVQTKTQCASTVTDCPALSTKPASVVAATNGAHLVQGGAIAALAAGLMVL